MNRSEQARVYAQLAALERRVEELERQVFPAPVEPEEFVAKETKKAKRANA